MRVLSKSSACRRWSASLFSGSHSSMVPCWFSGTEAGVGLEGCPKDEDGWKGRFRKVYAESLLAVSSPERKSYHR